MRQIIIKGDDSQVLNIRLGDIIDVIPYPLDYFWSILWLDATTISNSDLDIISLEKSIKQNENGLLIKVEDLISLDNHIYQLIEVIIIVDRMKDNMIRYSTDEIMYDSCDFCIELVDSSYWLITTSNWQEIVHNLHNKKIDYQFLEL